MPRVTIAWCEDGKECIHTAPTYSRFDGKGFGVRFYPANMSLIKLQILDGRVIDTKTQEDIGAYDYVKQVVTIEKELNSLSTTAKGGEQ